MINIADSAACSGPVPEKMQPSHQSSWEEGSVCREKRQRKRSVVQSKQEAFTYTGAAFE